MPEQRYAPLDSVTNIDIGGDDYFDLSTLRRAASRRDSSFEGNPSPAANERGDDDRQRLIESPPLGNIQENVPKNA